MLQTTAADPEDRASAKMRTGRCRRFAPRSTTSATPREMPSGWRRSVTAWPCSRSRCGYAARANPHLW